MNFFNIFASIVVSLEILFGFANLFLVCLGRVKIENMYNPDKKDEKSNQDSGQAD